MKGLYRSIFSVQRRSIKSTVQAIYSIKCKMVAATCQNLDLVKIFVAVNGRRAKRLGGRRPSAADLTELSRVAFTMRVRLAIQNITLFISQSGCLGGYRDWTPVPFWFSEMRATGIITLWLPNRDANRQPVTKS